MLKEKRLYSVIRDQTKFTLLVGKKLSRVIPLVASLMIASDAKVIQTADECNQFSQTKLYWWPGYMSEEDGSAFDVSLGFLPPENRPANDPPTFNSESGIPMEMRRINKDAVQDALHFSASFLRPAVFSAIVQNDVFTTIIPASNFVGEYETGLKALKVVRGNQDIVCCFLQDCPQYDLLSFRENKIEVLFHELLHDAWYTYFNDSDRADFATKARLFFNLGGGNWQTDELNGAIFLAKYHPDANDMNKLADLNFPPLTSNPDFDNWAQKYLGSKGFNGQEMKKIQSAILSYMKIRTILYGHTYRLADDYRDVFMVNEGFAYIGTNNYEVLNDYSDGTVVTKYIPAIMQTDYAKVLQADRLAVFVNNGAGYFSNEQKLKALETFMVDFFGFMKYIHPELNNIGK